MNYLLIGGLPILLLTIVLGLRLGWELLKQNGRMLLRMQALEKQIEGTEEGGKQKEETDQSLVTSVPTGDENERAERFSNRSLANSRIQRDGLKAGTPAPDFRLPRLDGGEFSLSELRGRFVLLIFSSPHCEPCNTSAPKLQKFHRKLPGLEMVMISQGQTDENRAKAKEHGLTFPIVLQRQWEVSRDYAYFATPVAYLIDPDGVIAADVAVGVDAIAKLMKQAGSMLARNEKGKIWALLKRVASWQPS